VTYGVAVLLLVAATDRELCGHDGLVCGVGPVEAAAATARTLALHRFDAVLHVGLAGGRDVAIGSVVVGTEAVYRDLSAEWPVVDRVTADAGLVERIRAALPDAAAAPIHTSAAVGASSGTVSPGPLIEGMEGLRRAAGSGACRRPRSRGAGRLQRDRRGGSLALAARCRARRARGRAAQDRPGARRRRRAMTRVLVTGMSGVGKSTVIAALGERGHRAVDTDSDTWSRWERLPDGSLDWVWREDAIALLLAEDDARPLFLAGCKSNQGRFYPQLTAVVLLTAPLETLLDRIAHRDTNPYGRATRSAPRRPQRRHRRAAPPPDGDPRDRRDGSGADGRRAGRGDRRDLRLASHTYRSRILTETAGVYLSAVARPRYPKKGEPLPPPLPPASRTVGQVVAEAIALYRANFAWALALGLPVALADQVLSTESIVARIALLTAASPAFSLAYAGACAIARVRCRRFAPGW
jgi:hypothetical protein